jgi:hypothetical protein
MPILRLIAKVRNVLPFWAPKSARQSKFSLVELQELAEREDFDKILTVAGVPDTPSPEVVSKKWSAGQEFDAAKFDDAAYKKYEKDFFSRNRQRFKNI